jgi:Malectin-like domain
MHVHPFHFHLFRYPDDPFDRIWEPDALQRPNFLYNVANGTKKVATNKTIFVNWDEAPPMKVMQTAVVGNNGILSYTMILDNFPGNAWAFSYLAEIEDLSPNETRIFKVEFPWGPPLNDALINVLDNARGKNRIYEPGFWNVSLPLITNIRFRQTNDSSRGPILNAFEIFKYVLINFGSLDGKSLSLCMHQKLSKTKFCCLDSNSSQNSFSSSAIRNIKTP